jgi:hypothetical protein
VDEPLNPTQRQVLDRLKRPAVEPAPVADGYAEGLRAQLEAELADVVEHLGGERIVVSKHALASVHACERHHLGEPDFEWTVRSARGTVAHKAIQLSVNWRGEIVPPELVDEALAILVDGETSLATWVGGLREAARAELRGEVVDLVTKFVESFPPLKASYKPVTESAVRVDLFDGLLRLQGKPDLTIGIARGNVPNKVVVDLKSGTPVSVHRDDLRFYALLETLRQGVPPRLLVSFYLDAGRPECEEVTDALLESALARAADGVRKIVETTRAVRAARVQPSNVCGWCRLRPDCSEGRAHWEQRDAELGR